MLPQLVCAMRRGRRRNDEVGHPSAGDIVEPQDGTGAAHGVHLDRPHGVAPRIMMKPQGVAHAGSLNAHMPSSPVPGGVFVTRPRLVHI